MEIVWSRKAYVDYKYWGQYDRKVVIRINKLIENIMSTPFTGLGKPEPLEYLLSGCWSRRIDQEHRLIYKIEGDLLQIISCKNHYAI